MVSAESEESRSAWMSRVKLNAPWRQKSVNPVDAPLNATAAEFVPCPLSPDLDVSSNYSNTVTAAVCGVH